MVNLRKRGNWTKTFFFFCCYRKNNFIPIVWKQRSFCLKIHYFRLEELLSFLKNVISFIYNLSKNHYSWKDPLMGGYPYKVDDLISLHSFRSSFLLKWQINFAILILFPFLLSTTPKFTKPFFSMRTVHLRDLFYVLLINTLRCWFQLSCLLGL